MGISPRAVRQIAGGTRVIATKSAGTGNVRGKAMKTRLRAFWVALIISFLWASSVTAKMEHPSLRLSIMKSELQRNLQVLKKEKMPPYFISYSIDHVRTQSAYSSFGALASKFDVSNANLTIAVRVGSFTQDNTHEIRGDTIARFQKYLAIPKKAPIEGSPQSLKVILWQGTDEAYKDAVEMLSKVKSDKTLKVTEEDTSNDFSEVKPSISIGEPLSIGFDLEKWAGRVCDYSAPFRKYPYILRAYASVTSEVRTKYFVNTDGSEILAPLNYMRLAISATAKADDGMELPLYLSYFGYRESDLPDEKKVMADIEGMIKTLASLRSAPMVDPYTGPALLSGKASGVFFHEILGHRLEGHRQKSENEGQTFKKKVNQPVLPDFISVIFDPTIRELQGSWLSGYYQFDDEGTKAERVVAIENGILKSFLMTRSPIQGFPKSNGHARSQPGKKPVSRQSNLIVTSNKQLTEKELRDELIRELRSQGKSFGLFFKEIQGGLTTTGRLMPNAFSVQPLVVYKVYVDGRPDELVRGVDLIGTPLATFEKIEATGKELQTFNGMCGAESGSVPVSAVSPSILVAQIEVQKKPKSQDRLPVLPPPMLEEKEGGNLP
jgi:TldD protein